MSSLIDSESSLSELSNRLRAVAEALRSIHADDAHFPEKIKFLQEEIKTIADQLRRLD